MSTPCQLTIRLELWYVSGNTTVTFGKKSHITIKQKLVILTGKTTKFCFQGPLVLKLSAMLDKAQHSAQQHNQGTEMN